MKGRGQQVVLPSLNPKVNYHSFPRRYEETKPAVVQEFTHRRIIDLGQLVAEQAAAKNDERQQEAIREAEKRVWAAAELDKKAAVENMAATMRVEHDRGLKKLGRAHTRVLEEEKEHVRHEVELEAEERLKETIVVWTLKLEKAIQETKEHCHKEAVEAVEHARREEQEAAKEIQDKLTKSFEEQLAKQVKDAELNKQEALSELASELEEEKRMALVQQGRQHDEKTAKKLAEQQAFFEQNIRILKQHVHEKKSVIKKLENQLMEMITAKDRIRQELFETREEFEMFIHRVKPFNKIDPKFVMPAPKTITLGITEEEWRKLWQ